MQGKTLIQDPITAAEVVASLSLRMILCWFGYEQYLSLTRFRRLKPAATALLVRPCSPGEKRRGNPLWLPHDGWAGTGPAPTPFAAQAAPDGFLF